MKNKLTVSIGIPAYNEEENIKNLLLSLLKQKQDSFKVKEIIVVSDGSNDKTVSIVKSIVSQQIKLMVGRKRRGKVFRQNEILKLVKSDVLVLLDADIIPEDNKFLRYLTRPIMENKADLVSGRVMPLPAHTLVEEIINFSTKMKNDFYGKDAGINQVYFCHGRVRAFSKGFRTKINWPKTIRSGEDAYSYFFCVSNNFKFDYQPKAKVLYRSPNSLGDHLKQSVRFMQSKRLMENYFDKNLVEKSYRLDRSRFLKIIFDAFVSSPFLLSSYSLIYVFSKLLSYFRKENKQVWDISISSKRL